MISVLGYADLIWYPTFLVFNRLYLFHFPALPLYPKLAINESHRVHQIHQRLTG